MGLFDDLSIAAPAPDPVPSFLLTMKRASNGAEILLCNVTPPPDAALAEAKLRKLPLFTTAEIPAVRATAADDPRALDLLITARAEFGWGGMITYKAT